MSLTLDGFFFELKIFNGSPPPPPFLLGFCTHFFLWKITVSGYKFGGGRGNFLKEIPLKNLVKGISLENYHVGGYSFFGGNLQFKKKTSLGLFLTRTLIFTGQPPSLIRRENSYGVYGIFHISISPVWEKSPPLKRTPVGFFE